MSPASERPADPIHSALPDESLLSSVDPSSEAIATSPVPQFPADYDPDWANKPPHAKPRYRRGARKHKAPKDSRIYKAVTAVIALKAQGYKTDAIAEALGLTPHTIREYVYTAHKRGWVNVNTFSDPEDQLDIVLKSKAITNLNTLLDETEEDTGRLTTRAGVMSLEVAKGTGLLKVHSVDKGVVAPQMIMALRVQVDIPQLPVADQRALPTVRQGSVGGVPSFDAEIIGEP